MTLELLALSLRQLVLLNKFLHGRIFFALSGRFLGFRLLALHLFVHELTEVSLVLVQLHALFIITSTACASINDLLLGLAELLAQFASFQLLEFEADHDVISNLIGILRQHNRLILLWVELVQSTLFVLFKKPTLLLIQQILLFEV